MPTPTSPAGSDKTTTQSLYENMTKDQKPLINFWEMIRERPTTKTSADISKIHLDLIPLPPEDGKDRQKAFYLLQRDHEELRSENYGRKYFKDCPKLPDDVVSWLVSCAVKRGCDMDGIVRRFGKEQDGLGEMMRVEKKRQEEEEANEKAKLEEEKNVKKDGKASSDT